MFLAVDWRHVRHIKREQPQLMIGLLNRYCLLVGLICSMVDPNIPSEANCRPLTLATNLCDSIAVELASIGLTLRIVAAWGQGRMVSQRTAIVFFLVCLLTQASLFLEAPVQGCVMIIGNSTPTLGYTFNMPYTLALLASAGWMYARPSHKLLHHNRISVQELCCFGVAFLASFVNTVLIWLDLSPVMAVVTVMPSTVVISIASGRMICLWGGSSDAHMQPDTTERHLTAIESPYRRHRFNFSRWLPKIGSPAHEDFDALDFRRLSSAATSHAGSMRAANSTRPSSIVLPSLISPSSAYSPHRASQGPSTHLDSASESSDRGDRYDLDAQLGAAQRRSL